MTPENPAIDLDLLRQRLDSAKGPQYWKSLEELAGTPEFQAFAEDEFTTRGLIDWADPNNRRNFLKLMGASLALAGVSACTKQPKETIVPYVKQPEDFIPGRPMFYATAMPQNGVAAGILVESHLGRPTKVEGNPDHPGSNGSANIFAQASVLTLYDPDRSQVVLRTGQISSWPAFVAAMITAKQNLGGPQDPNVKQEAAKSPTGKLRILTGATTSPTLLDQMSSLLKQFPAAKWVRYEPAQGNGAAAAFGKRINPVYHLDKADVIVSLDGDFLNNGPAVGRYGFDYAQRRQVQPSGNPGGHANVKELQQEGYQDGPIPPFRNQAASQTELDKSPAQGPMGSVENLAKPDIKNTVRNRLYVVESAPSLTGGMADHRFALKPSEVESFAHSLAAALGAGGGVASGSPHPAIPAIAKDLQAGKGKALVIAGEYQPASVHALAYAMNQALGSIGQTVTYTDPLDGGVPGEGVQALRELVGEMRAGQVDTLLILGGNPVYDAPADLDFAGAMNNVKLRAHLGLYNDETAELCHWHVPQAHFLETWSDARGYDGTVTIMQPLIAPLYSGRSIHEIIQVLLTGSDTSSHDIVKGYWTNPGGTNNFNAAWQTALHNGVVPNTALPATTVTAKAPASASSIGGGLELVIRPDPTIGDGQSSNNGWLQELPKPLTRVTWDNAVWLNPKTAQKVGVAEGDMVELRYAGRTLKAPVWVTPGQASDCATIHLGYGKTRSGHVGNELGFNAYKLVTADAPWGGPGLEIHKTGGKYSFAATQHTQTMEEREPVRVGTIDEYKSDPEFVDKKEKPVGKELTIYPNYKYEGYKWGMSIDLNTCIGCGACSVACQAENNIPVVGKVEVARGRQMNWIRIDRYYEGSLDEPKIYFQPVPCMHCEDAPCEPVCPVAATVHSGDGLNQMVYNRCVGTRYCSNNCPYKVRRFNFLLYSDWNTQSLYPLRNPDVTVRSRGVMEKCSYCVQRINAAKIDSERENRRIRDGEVVTACQQACPTQAIVFGDINDVNSKVAKAKAEPREYSLLEELNTRPRTTYLARLRNPNPEIEKG